MTLWIPDASERREDMKEVIQMSVQVLQNNRKI